MSYGCFQTSCGVRYVPMQKKPNTRTEGKEKHELYTTEITEINDLRPIYKNRLTHTSSPTGCMIGLYNESF